jgi:hypothetical protein
MTSQTTKLHLEALMDMLMKWRQNTGESPRELALSEKNYLGLASDLGFESMGAPPRFIYRRPSYAFGTLDATVAAAALEEIRIADSFVFHGPGGPITIRNADAEKR